MTEDGSGLAAVARFWWHRLRGHKFALRGPGYIVCLTDLTVLPRGGRYR